MKIENTKKAKKMILMLGMVMSLGLTSPVKVQAAEINQDTVQEDIEAGAIGTPVEDTLVTTNEVFYDEADFEKDLIEDPNIGQEIDPEKVQTEAERKGIKPTPEPTKNPDPTPTQAPKKEETTVEIQKVVVQNDEEVTKPMPKTGLDYLEFLKLIKEYAGVFAAGGVVANSISKKNKENSLR